MLLLSSRARMSAGKKHAEIGRKPMNPLLEEKSIHEDEENGRRRSGCRHCRGLGRRRSRNHFNDDRAKTFDVEMNGTEAAANFVKRLPLSQPFENFGKLERITYLKPALNTGKDALAASPKRGDLAYYIPWGNLCVFLIGGNAPSDDLVILRHMGEEALAALEKSGTSRVELREKK